MKETGQEEKMDGNNTQQQQVRAKTSKNTSKEEITLQNRKFISISSSSFFTHTPFEINRMFKMYVHSIAYTP